jgi:hypothetical protein
MIPSSFSNHCIAENFVVQGGLLDNFDTSNNFNMSTLHPSDFAFFYGYLFNTWLYLGFCPTCYWALSNYVNDVTTFPDGTFVNSTNSFTWIWYSAQAYDNNKAWLAVYLVCCILLMIAGISAVMIESMTVAPDILGYASNVARNNRYLHLPPTTSDMKGSQRIQVIGDTEVMMQDVKANAQVGKIALGNKHEKAHRLVPGRAYR